jgi:hypothetical protein
VAKKKMPSLPKWKSTKVKSAKVTPVKVKLPKVSLTKKFPKSYLRKVR